MIQALVWKMKKIYLNKWNKALVNEKFLWNGTLRVFRDLNK